MTSYFDHFPVIMSSLQVTTMNQRPNSKKQAEHTPEWNDAVIK